MQGAEGVENLMIPSQQMSVLLHGVGEEMAKQGGDPGVLGWSPALCGAP